MQNQINAITEGRNAAEAAICLLHTELTEACNVANALAHAAPTATTAAAAAATTAGATAATAPAPVHTVDKIPFPNKCDSTRSKLRAFTTQL